MCRSQTNRPSVVLALRLALPVALLAFVALAGTASAEGEQAEAAPPESIAARVRLYLNDITKFDPATGFTADVYLGLGCSTVCTDPKVVVNNGKVSAREVLLDTPQMKGYRMELTLTDKIDFHQYPFDSHALSIVLISAQPASQFQFVADPAAAEVGNIRLQGWQIDPSPSASAWVQSLNSVAPREVPVYRFSVTVSRPTLAGILKVMLPGLAILLVGSLGLVVGPEERIKRFDLFNAAFLGTVLFQLSVMSSLPPLSYLTFADRFLLVNLLSIIIGVASSVWIILAFRSGRKAHSWAIHEWSMAVIPLVWFGLQSMNALAVFVFDASDPRLWAVGAGELLLAGLALAWRARRTTFQTRFRAAYCRILDQTRDPAEALKQALDTFAAERPLGSLTRAEVGVLAELFGPLSDPLVLADVLVSALREQDASVLKDRPRLERFAQFVAERQQQQQPGVGPAATLSQAA